VSAYTTFPWPAMCKAIVKLKLTWRPPTLSGPPDPARSTAVTCEERSRNRWTNKATPAGFEPEVELNLRAGLRCSPAKFRVPLGGR
jgi:hypothetical protein